MLKRINNYLFNQFLTYNDEYEIKRRSINKLILLKIT